MGIETKFSKIMILCWWEIWKLLTKFRCVDWFLIRLMLCIDFLCFWWFLRLRGVDLQQIMWIYVWNGHFINLVLWVDFFHRWVEKYLKVDTEMIILFGINNNIVYVCWSKTSLAMYYYKVAIIVGAVTLML